MKKICSSLFLLALLAAMMFGAAMPLNATVYYVAPTSAGNGSGTDWDNAMPLGGTAVITAADGDVYKLKQGTYTTTFPVNDASDRTFITAANNVQILGGYTGNSSNPDERVLNPANTVFQGQSFTSKAIRGVMANQKNSVMISGITFQDFVSVSMGGAIFLRGNSANAADKLTVEDCIFQDNDLSSSTQQSASGPGIFVSDNTGDAYVEITRCKFVNNSGRADRGVVGIGNNSASKILTVNISDCEFNANLKGGAITLQNLNAASVVTVTNSLFVGNANGTSAGSVITTTGTNNPSLSISNCTFVDNYSASVNAINNTSTNASISNCIFDRTTGTGTITKTNTLDITSTGLTLDYTAYPAGVPTGGTVSIPYTINVDYSVPVMASVDGGTATAASSPYSIAVSANTTLALAATPYIPVTVTEGTHSHASISGLTASGYSSTGTYPISGTVTADADYHSPYVSVDGVYVPVASDGTFTYTPAVAAAITFTVTATAYPENVIPVTEDTRVLRTGGGTYVDVNYNSDVLLVGRKATSGYENHRAYVKFVLPTGIKEAYNEVSLKFTKVSTSTSTGSCDLRTVPDAVITTAFNALTFTNSGAGTSGDFEGTVLATTAIANEITFDVSSLVSAAGSNTIFWQIAPQDGNYLRLHSLENGNAAYVPQLIFSDPVQTAISTAIADDNAPVRYYNLQGIEVAAPVKGNIYIVRQGAKAKKVVY
jgi:hypothetical protein